MAVGVLALGLAALEVHAAIPTGERAALIAVYNSTNGGSWTHRDNWRNPGNTAFNDPGTECAWYGVTCDVTEDHVEAINLGHNNLDGTIPATIGDFPSLVVLSLLSNPNLTGSIPASIGNLAALQSLNAYDGSLTGSLPPELGNLSNLTSLELYNLALLGEIPAEIGQLTNLTRLDLQSNLLTGPIPGAIGNLVSLQDLSLDSNMFTGEIPTELADLSTLVDMTGLNLKWNGLHTDDVFLAAFLNLKHSSLGDWRDTQTIAPENLTVVSASDHTVWLGWDGVAYTEDEGGTESLVAPAGTGLWVSAGWTSSKSETSYPVTGLDPTTPFDFAVVTFTDPHLGNRNLVTSDLSQIENTTTTSLGCPSPEIFIDYGPVTVLSVPGPFMSYLWSTGETTATIDVPLESQWYWVRTSSAGGCEDSAVAWVTPLVFMDGFETGDLSGWGSP